MARLPLLAPVLALVFVAAARSAVPARCHRSGVTPATWALPRVPELSKRPKALQLLELRGGGISAAEDDLATLASKRPKAMQLLELRGGGISAAEDKLATLAAHKNTGMVVGALAAILEAIDFAVRHGIPYSRYGAAQAAGWNQIRAGGSSAKEPAPAVVDPDNVMEGPQQELPASLELLWEYSAAVRTMMEKGGGAEGGRDQVHFEPSASATCSA